MTKTWRIGALMQSVLCTIMAALPWVSPTDYALLAKQSIEVRFDPFAWTGLAVFAAAMLGYGAVKPSVYWRLRGFGFCCLFWASAAYVYQIDAPGTAPVLFFSGSSCAVLVALVHEVLRKPRSCGKC